MLGKFCANVLNISFCTEKLNNASRKLQKLRNTCKYSVFISNAAVFIMERNSIVADFDHVLGNHFNKTKL